MQCLAPAGWDFSSRWLRDGRTLASCCTTDIVPVDLNAFLYQMESNIADFASRLGHQEAAAAFWSAAEARRTAIDELMHDRLAGAGCRLLCWHYMSTRYADSLCNPLLLRCASVALLLASCPMCCRGTSSWHQIRVLAPHEGTDFWW